MSKGNWKKISGYVCEVFALVLVGIMLWRKASCEYTGYCVTPQETIPKSEIGYVALAIGALVFGLTGMLALKDVENDGLKSEGGENE